MKVCMVSGAFPPMRCGIGDYTARLVAELACQGIEVDVLSRDDPLVEPGGTPGVRVFPVLRKTPAADAPAIARHAGRQRCDVIHIQYPTWPFRRSLTISLVPALLKLFRAGPVAVTAHEVARCHPINRLRLVPIAYTADAVTATTEEDCAWLSRHLPLVGRRVIHIPIGANLEPPEGFGRCRAAYRRRLGIGEGDIAMCFFGFVFRNKLIEDLLAAFRLAADHGARLRLVLMTGMERTEGTYGAEVVRMIDDLGLAGRVVHTGFLPAEEVSRCFGACDFASLLFRDGASFRRGSILAAMAHGLPVVSCRSGPIPAGFQHGENILLSDAGDVEGLAENMVRLCTDTALRNKLARASLRTARRFAWPLIAERTAALYRKMLR